MRMRVLPICSKCGKAGHTNAKCEKNQKEKTNTTTSTTRQPQPQKKGRKKSTFCTQRYSKEEGKGWSWCGTWGIVGINMEECAVRVAGGSLWGVWIQLLNKHNANKKPPAPGCALGQTSELTWACGMAIGYILLYSDGVSTFMYILSHTPMRPRTMHCVKHR
jgi:hypothetical protein